MNNKYMRTLTKITMSIMAITAIINFYIAYAGWNIPTSDTSTYLGYAILCLCTISFVDVGQKRADMIEDIHEQWLKSLNRERNLIDRLGSSQLDVKDLVNTLHKRNKIINELEGNKK